MAGFRAAAKSKKTPLHLRPHLAKRANVMSPVQNDNAGADVGMSDNDGDEMPLQVSTPARVAPKKKKKMGMFGKMPKRGGKPCPPGQAADQDFYGE